MPSEADMVVVGDNKLIQAADKTDELFTRFIVKNNPVMAADNFLNGADVYGATSLRCIFQFYFCLRLPNGYDHPNIENDALASALGWIGATALIAFIGWTGYQFNKDQKQLWIERQFTDEFLLTFYALGYDIADKKRETVLESNLVEIRRLLLELEKNEAFQKNKTDIQAVVKDSKKLNAILNILSEEHSDKRLDNPTKARTYWKNTYDYIVHFAYAQWLFWMATTIVLCQAIDGYTTENADLSGAFTKDIIGHEALLYVQALIGFVVATAILYLKKHPSPDDIAKENKMKNQQDALRKWWLTHDVKDFGNRVALTDEHINQNVLAFDKAIGYSRALTVTNTFICNFLLVNIAIWPMAVFFREGFHIDSEPAEEYVTVFLIAIAFAALCATIKYRDVTSENDEIRKVIRSGYDPTVKINQQNRVETEDFWLKNKEHFHQFIYIVIGGVLGSGGFLFTRTIFSGGIGNVDFDELFEGNLTDSKDLMKHGGFTDPLFLMGVCATVLMIGLQMCEYYKNTQRKEILADANDYKLKTPQI